MVKMYCELMGERTLGRYLAADAGRLAGIDGDRIGQWARWGHIRASVSDGDPHVYAFLDVADALAVRLLLDGGVRLPVIRRAVDALGGAHPLTDGLHLVDGRLAVERERGLEDVFTTQRVLEMDQGGDAVIAGVKDRGRLDPVALLRAGGWPSLMTGVAVEVDPERAAGVPCRPGTRTPVRDALDDDADLRRWWACVG